MKECLLYMESVLRGGYHVADRLHLPTVRDVGLMGLGESLDENLYI